jgi:hypothetical protein
LRAIKLKTGCKGLSQSQWYYLNDLWFGDLEILRYRRQGASDSEKLKEAILQISSKQNDDNLNISNIL